MLCESASKEIHMVFQTLNVNRDGAVLCLKETIKCQRLIKRATLRLPHSC